jgi:hypothetical protein
MIFSYHGIKMEFLADGMLEDLDAGDLYSDV